MQGYASPQPRARDGEQVKSEQSTASPAIQTNISGAIVSSMIGLDGRTTVIEVTTGNGPAGLKWFGSVIGSDNIHPSVTAATVDNYIPANMTRRFVVPQSVAGIAHIGSTIGGFGKQNGLYHQVAVIPVQANAPTSIFTSQFI